MLYFSRNSIMLVLVYMIYECHADIFFSVIFSGDMHLSLGTCTLILILETRLNAVRVNFSKIPVMVHFL